MSLTRRHFVRTGAAAATGALAAPTMLRVAGGQTPAASPAPAVEFAPGIVPTVFGDIEIPQNVSKVVAITDGAVDALFSLGIVPVGVTASSNGTSVADYLKDDAPAEMVYVGSWAEVDFEQVVALSPDLILGDRYTLPDWYEPLSAIAPVICPLEIDVPDADSLQQWEYEGLAWAHALGKLTEAQALNDEVRSRAASIQPQLGEHEGQSVVVFRPQAEFPVAMSQAWITGRMLTWSGLRGNEYTEQLPPPHSAREISLEQLDMLDANWFFLGARDAEMAEAIGRYLDNPLFQTLDAYQAGQMAQVDGALWSGSTGVLAAHAMLDDIERIIVRGEGLLTMES